MAIQNISAVIDSVSGTPKALPVNRDPNRERKNGQGSRPQRDPKNSADQKPEADASDRKSDQGGIDERV